MKFSPDAKRERVKESIGYFLGSDDNSDSMISTNADNGLGDCRHRIKCVGE